MVMKLKNLLSLSTLLIFSLFFLPFSLSNSDFTSLLAFKSSSDPSNSLSSWSVSLSDHHPCSSWLGVSCHPLTHRVSKLVLNNLNLTGSIQPLTRLTQLRHLSLHNNRLSSDRLNLNSWPNLKHLYLSHNRFAGIFPAGFAHLRRLRRLDLSYNQFSGEIPMSGLTQLPHLITLRLEFNSFSGPLNSYDSLSPTNSLSDFNVSCNYLAGKIPTLLAKFPATSFAGNIHLCGQPLTFDCPNKTVASNSAAPAGYSIQIPVPGGKKNKDKLSGKAVLMIIATDAAAVAAVLVIMTWCCYMKRLRDNRSKKDGEGGKKEGRILYGGVYGNNGGGDDEEEMVCFEGCKGFSKVDDLLKSSAEMMGKGSVGTTYKVVMMDGGDALVVKRVREKRKRKEVVGGLLTVIGGLRHPNVVSLRAYYSSMDELLLVYDFLPNGSLHSLLHGNRGPGRTPLDWTTRLKLARGSARGLAFLHDYSNKCKLFHGHFTSSNIIVDISGNACVSDIGLYQLLLIPYSTSFSNAYKAPELLSNNCNNNNNNRGSSSQSRRFSQKCDVYSFGVVMLEILTGKVASSEGETSLVAWIQRVVREEESVWEVLDFELLRYKEMEEEMVGLMQVALLCLATSPKDRPRMSMVQKMIEDIMRRKTRNSKDLISSVNNSSPSLSETTPNFTSSC